MQKRENLFDRMGPEWCLRQDSRSKLTTASCDYDLWPLGPKCDRFIPLPRWPLVPICSKICLFVFKISCLEDWQQTDGRTEGQTKRQTHSQVENITALRSLDWWRHTERICNYFSCLLKSMRERNYQTYGRLLLLTDVIHYLVTSVAYRRTHLLRRHCNCQ